MSAFTMRAGDSRYFTITVTLDAAAQNLAGWTVWFVAKESVDDADSLAPIFKYTGAGVTHTNESGGIARATVLPADTDQYNATGASLVYEVQVLTANGELYTIDSGTITVEAAVIRATQPGAAGLILGDEFTPEPERISPAEMLRRREKLQEAEIVWPA